MKWEDDRWESIEVIKQRDYPVTYLSFYTQNVWFASDNYINRYNVIIQMAEEMDTDFICFQEVTKYFMKFINDSKILRERYYMSGNTIWGYGVLLLSKYPTKFYRMKYKKTMMGRDLLFAQLSFNGSKFIVATSHLESQKNASTRKAQMLQVEQVLENQQKIFMGDFNFEYDAPAGKYPCLYFMHFRIF